MEPADWVAEARRAAAMPVADFVTCFERQPATTRIDLLRGRFRFDVGGFLRWCWPDLFSRPWNAFHEVLLDRELPPSHERDRDVRYAWAAPRGIAKTTMQKGLLAHALVYGLEEFVIVLSAEMRLARSISSNVRGWFAEKGSPLSELYGPFKLRGGVEEWSVTVGWADWLAETKRGVLARSFGTPVRGANLDVRRPTRIVVDDGERSDRVNNPEQRTEWQMRLDDDVLRCGPIDGGLVVDWVGTVLHPDAILARLLKSGAWGGGKYKALITWPERMDLWERAGAVYNDLTLGEEATRYACASAFYRANREAMDAGAEVLDEAALPLFDFFVAIWQLGMRSVLRELQNEPRDPAARIFDESKTVRCKVLPGKGPGDQVIINGANGSRVAVRDCRLSTWWDPAVGDQAGDFAAIVVIARDKWGYGYVIAAWMRRAPRSAQLAALWSLAEQVGFTRAHLEANGFQRNLADDFRRMRRERQEADKHWQLQLEEVTSSAKKEDRIADLEVPVSNGWLQFAENLSPEAMHQLWDFPGADHDDFPDAVQGAWAELGGQGPSMGQTRVQ